jgi:phage recombination protein Bet
MSLSQQVVNYPVSNEHNMEITQFKVLKETLYPGASDEEAAMVLNYCRARRLDPMLKPVHLVKMRVKSGKKDSYGKEQYEYRNVVMPGIGSYRIDAARTGEYAGMTEPEFGKDIIEKIGNIQVKYPEWCKITVKKLLTNGLIAEYTAKEFWRENYATKSKDDISPNDMWFKRAYGQLAKCTEAQALRKAFPDSVGSHPTSDEMEGKTFAEVDTLPHKQEVKQIIEAVQIIDPEPEINIDEMVLDISQTASIDELEKVFKTHYKVCVGKRDKEALDKIIIAKNTQKIKFETEQFVRELDGEEKQ